MFSATDHLGGNITKSSAATPGFVVGHVSTVNMQGSLTLIDCNNIEIIRTKCSTWLNSLTNRRAKTQLKNMKNVFTMWSKDTELTVQNFARSYLKGT